MPNHRYPKQCYNMLRSFSDSGKINWAYGFGYVWEANTVGDGVHFVNVFRQRVKDCFVQQWHSNIENSPKALYYKHFKFI